MAWKDLYRWEKGFEPADVIELRRVKNERTKAWQAEKFAKQNAKIERLATKVIGKAPLVVQQASFDALKVAVMNEGIKIGESALKRRLKALRYDCSNVSAKHSGWPKSWPKHISRFVANWLESGHVVKSIYADDFVSIEDIANRCIKDYIRNLGDDDICDFVTSRSLKLALESKCYSPIKIREGLISLIGHKLA